MNNFEYSLPTRFIFGQGNIEKIGNFVPQFGRRVLLVYGKGSIKRNGIYDKVIKSLEHNQCKIWELSGVQPNPVIDKVREGVKIAKENNIQVVIPVGGGSVWDSAKVIAAGALYDGDPWDFFEGEDIKKALPIVGILTLPATSTESNPIAVITNKEKKQKKAVYNFNIQPKITIIDPTALYSIPKDFLVYGMIDIFSHLLEGYSDRAKTMLLDTYSINTMKLLMKLMPMIKENQNNYDLAAELFWTATVSHGGLLYAGRNGGDWACHKIEHAISANYDFVIHGAGLSIVTPAWLRYVWRELPEKYEILFRELFNLYGSREYIVEKGIDLLEAFFKGLGAPIRLSEYKEIDVDKAKNEILDTLEEYYPFGQVKQLIREDVSEIYELFK